MSGTSRHSENFSPHATLHEPSVKGKKLSLERRKRVTVVLLPAHVSAVLRGATLQQLIQDDRVQDVLFLQSWTELRVRQTICEAFLSQLYEDDPEGDILLISSNAGAGISGTPDPLTLPGSSTGRHWVDWAKGASSSQKRKPIII